MKKNLTREELKMKNELLKNKTEKLKLFRNIVAVISIIISLITLIFFKGGGNSNNINTNPKGVVEPTISEIKLNNNSGKESIDKNIDNDQDDDDDKDDLD